MKYTPKKPRLTVLEEAAQIHLSKTTTTESTPFLTVIQQYFACIYISQATKTWMRRPAARSPGCTIRCSARSVRIRATSKRDGRHTGGSLPLGHFGLRSNKRNRPHHWVAGECKGCQLQVGKFLEIWGGGA